MCDHSQRPHVRENPCRMFALRGLYCSRETQWMATASRVYGHELCPHVRRSFTLIPFTTRLFTSFYFYFIWNQTVFLGFYRGFYCHRRSFTGLRSVYPVAWGKKGFHRSFANGMREKGLFYRLKRATLWSVDLRMGDAETRLCYTL